MRLWTRVPLPRLATAACYITGTVCGHETQLMVAGYELQCHRRGEDRRTSMQDRVLHALAALAFVQRARGANGWGIRGSGRECGVGNEGDLPGR